MFKLTRAIYYESFVDGTFQSEVTVDFDSRDELNPDQNLESFQFSITAEGWSKKTAQNAAFNQLMEHIHEYVTISLTNRAH